MKQIILAVSISLFLFSPVFCQVEVSAYYSLLYPLEKEIMSTGGTQEKFGAAVEYSLNEKLGIELWGSYNQHTSGPISMYINDPDYHLDGLYFYNSQITNTLLTISIKKYSAKRKPDAGIFYGAYVRYWIHAYRMMPSGPDTSGYINYLENNPYIHFERDHKISLGLLAGYKGNFFRSFTWCLSAGAGFSPAFLYFQHLEYYSVDQNTTKRISRVMTLYHLSFLSHLSIGYRF